MHAACPRVADAPGRHERADPDRPVVLHQLAAVYAVQRNLPRARAAALRLAQVEPRYPGLVGLLATLGVPAAPR